MTTTLQQLDTRYGTLSIFPNDSGAATQSLRSYGEWAENELSFMHRFVSIGGLVLDVGAYVGTHTLAFSRFVGPQGRVISVEAQPESYRVLSANIAANGLEIVTAYHAIATDEVGQVGIPVLDVNSSASFGSASLHDVLLPGHESGPGNGIEVETVPALTIDSLNLDRCDLIKIDVEGVEDLVLRGAGETLRRLAPVVYCECNSVEDGLRSLSLLQSHGYDVFAHVVQAFNADNFRRNEENIFGEACEVALVGVPPGRQDQLFAEKIRAVELVLKLVTADDLVLALLNKPQYAEEVLRPSQAAHSGAGVYLDHLVTARLRLESLETENQALHHKIETETADYKQRISGVYAEKARDAKNYEARLEDYGARLEDYRTRLQHAYDEKTAEAVLYEERLSRLSLHLTLVTEQASIARQEANGRAVAQAALRTEIEDLNNRIRAIYGSTSWRLTGPMRRVVRLLKRIL